MFAFLVGLGIGCLLGLVGLVWFSKNNKNTIAKMREELVTVVGKGEDAVRNVVEKYTKK